MRGTLSGAGRIYAVLALLILILGAFSFLSLSSARAETVDEGKAIFEQKCKGCHSIGGGKLVGPDLKGLSERRDKASAARFITAPTGQMPNLGISQQDAEKIVAYIDSASTGSTGQSAVVRAGTAEDVERGRQLFTGGVGLSNGGVACASCHNVKGSGASWGGNLAKDLSTASSTLGPDALSSILRTTPFPIMREAYAGHPLTEAEIGYLTAFLQRASSAGQQAQAGNLILYLVMAAVGLIIVMALFQIVWRGRLQGVRQSLVKGGSK
ncbi:MAG: c-type cytochrome [Dehalococcoidia bacterium]|nr:c-type cytochrome [Dehalococcoidia bacterium]